MLPKIKQASESVGLEMHDHVILGEPETVLMVKAITAFLIRLDLI